MPCAVYIEMVLTAFWSFRHHSWVMSTHVGGNNEPQLNLADYTCVHLRDIIQQIQKIHMDTVYNHIHTSCESSMLLHSPHHLDTSRAPP